MIYTSNYNNSKQIHHKTYSISGDKGIKANYDGKTYSSLAPLKHFYEKWHNNQGKISEEENNRYYIKEYYKHILSKLDAETVYNHLENTTLLCYEEAHEFCHRHIIAAWFEILLNVTVPEIKIMDSKTINLKRPEYIKEYLIDIMKELKDMKNFTSLRALYLYEKACSLEEQAKHLEEITGKNYDRFRQYAIYLKCEAYEIENNLDNLTLIKK